MIGREIIMPNTPYIAEDLAPLVVPIETVVGMNRNPRSHGDRSIDAIRRSLTGFRQLKPVVLHADGRTVIAGNGTLQAAIALGWTHIAVVKSGLDGVRATAYAIADNRTADLSSFNTNILADTLRSLDAAGAVEIGYTSGELDSIFGVNPLSQPSSAPTAAPSVNSDSTQHFRSISEATVPSQTASVGLIENEVQPMGDFSTIVVTGTREMINRIRTRLDRMRQEHGLQSLAEVIDRLIGEENQP
jgi:hypothetical protein